MVKFGCAWFDDPCALGPATIAESGGALGRRIADFGNLASDVIWLSNLNYDQMISTRLSFNAHFRNNGYLRRKTHQILTAIGMEEKPVEEQVQALADIFSRVVRLAHHFLDFNYVPPEHSFNRGLRTLLGYPDSPLPEFLARAIDDANKSYTQCLKNGYAVGERKYRTFLLSPWEHARTLLTAPMPDGSWRHLKGKDVPCDPIKFAENAGPFLARVTVNKIDPDLSALLNYGSNARGSRDNRQWVAATELIAILQLAADVTVHEAVVWDGVTNFRPLLSRLTDKLPDDECNMLCYSLGLLAENLWTGIAATLPPKNRGHQSYANPISPFLRSHDLVRCLGAARGLQQLGFDVQSFGTGAVMIDAANVSDQALLDASRQLNLLPPPCPGADPSIEAQDQVPAIWALQNLFACQQSHQILNIDRQIVDDVVLGGSQ